MKAQVSSLLLYIIIGVALVVILILFIQVGTPIKACVDSCNEKLEACYNSTGVGVSVRVVDALAKVNLTGLMPPII